jgi:hypothetical protein
MGLPESKMTPVEKMGVSALLEELEAWRVHGETYLSEDGYDSCYSDMQRYVKRCIEIGPKANVIRENFEGMRDLMVRTGNQVLEDLNDDPYADSVLAALNGSDRLLENNNSSDPERDPNFWDQKLPTSEDRINRDYRHVVIEGEQPYEASGGLSDSSGLRMDDLRGEGGVADKSPTKSDGRSAGGSAAGYHARQKGQGVAKKGAKPVDGRKGEASTSGSAGGSLRMDDLAGGGGVQEHGVGSSDGRKAGKSVSQQSESTISVSGGDPATAKGGYSSVGLSMGKDFQGSGKGSVVPKSLSKGDGAKGDGASSAKNYKMSGLSDGGVDMAKDFQGRGGLADQTPSGEHPGDKGKVGSEGGLKKASRSGDMSGQQGSGGVAESITPERIAALITLTEECDNGCSQAKCGDSCECPKGCSCKTVSEGEMPEALKKFQKKKGGGTEGDGKDDKSESDNPFANGGPKDDKDKDKDEDEDDSDSDFPLNDDQYKGPSKKYKNRGLKKSAINPVSEGKTAVIVAQDPTDLADIVDQVLGGEDMSATDLGSALGEEAPELEPELEDSGGLDDLGGGDDLGGDMPPSPDEGGDDEASLEDNLDGALGDDLVEGADEGPSDSSCSCGDGGECKCDPSCDKCECGSGDSDSPVSEG